MCLPKRRYHRDIGFPAGTLLHPPVTSLYYKHHAMQALDNDDMLRHRPLDLPDYAECIEVTTNPDGSVFRWVMRMPVLPQQDLVLVIEVDGTVVTAWVNARTDVHHTLNRSLYSIPKEVRHAQPVTP